MSNKICIKSLGVEDLIETEVYGGFKVECVTHKTFEGVILFSLTHLVVGFMERYVKSFNTDEFKFASPRVIKKGTTEYDDLIQEISNNS